jgi:two-component system, OmpR family, phosphate regulon response regulator PhoB
MIERDYTVLLADPDARMRALVAEQLTSIGCTVLQAGDGETALRMVTERPIRLVVAELYLKAGNDDDLIHAIRRNKSLRKTRTLALTTSATRADRDWAMRAGADAYLIKPTRAERLRYVVTRLATAKGANASVPMTSSSPLSRRDSLDMALGELERGSLKGTSAIVFGRIWWDQLSRPEQTTYRKRARRAGVTLRSDSMIGEHFVEVRGMPSGDPLSTERSESPYRSR